MMVHVGLLGTVDTCLRALTLWWTSGRSRAETFPRELAAELGWEAARDTRDAQAEAGSVMCEIAKSEQHRLARDRIGRAESGGHNRGSEAVSRCRKPVVADVCGFGRGVHGGSQDPWRAYKLSLIHISEPTRLGMISYAVFCL